MFYRIFIISTLLLFACTKANKKDQEDQPEIISENSNTKITHSLGEVLNPQARKVIETWNEYAAVENIINEYYNISTTKALSNAQELSNATQQLRDSIRVERFKEADLKIRLNVLHNSALRLNDMREIPEIDEKEIKTEVSNLINTFTSITSKLNNVVNQKNLEKELINFNKSKN